MARKRKPFCETVALEMIRDLELSPDVDLFETDLSCFHINYDHCSYKVYIEKAIDVSVFQHPDVVLYFRKYSG